MVDRTPLDQQTINDLRDENASLRRMVVPPAAALPGSNTGLYVSAAIALALINVAAIVGVEVARPAGQNASLDTLITGILGPLMVAFMAAAVKEVHVAFNSRMTEMLVLTRQAATAEGQLAEKKEAAALHATTGNEGGVDLGR